LWPSSMIELEFRNGDFCGGRKTGELEKNPRSKGRESTTNSTHILHRVWKSNPLSVNMHGTSIDSLTILIQKLKKQAPTLTTISTDPVSSSINVN
jgi:hypothetical protein